jgi:hypothetical protein
MDKKITEITRKYNPFIPPTRLRVCAYVRVSTEHEGQLNSLQNQTEYYERLLGSVQNWILTNQLLINGLKMTNNHQENSGIQPRGYLHDLKRKFPALIVPTGQLLPTMQLNTVNYSVMQEMDFYH